MKLRVGLQLEIDKDEFSTSLEGDVGRDIAWLLMEYLWDVEGVEVNAISVQGEKVQFDESTD